MVSIVFFDTIPPMNKNLYIGGVILGLLVPVIGVFVGLQVSTLLGNILAFPIILIVSITGTPFGYWGAGMWVLAAVLSIGLWTAIVAFVSSSVKR